MRISWGNTKSNRANGKHGNVAMAGRDASVESICRS